MHFVYALHWTIQSFYERLTTQTLSWSEDKTFTEGTVHKLLPLRIMSSRMWANLKKQKTKKSQIKFSQGWFLSNDAAAMRLIFFLVFSIAIFVPYMYEEEVCCINALNCSFNELESRRSLWCSNRRICNFEWAAAAFSHVRYAVLKAGFHSTPPFKCRSECRYAAACVLSSYRWPRLTVISEIMFSVSLGMYACLRSTKINQHVVDDHRGTEFAARMFNHLF